MALAGQKLGATIQSMGTVQAAKRAPRAVFQSSRKAADMVVRKASLAKNSVVNGGQTTTNLATVVASNSEDDSAAEAQLKSDGVNDSGLRV